MVLETLELAVGVRSEDGLVAVPYLCKNAE